MAGRDPRGYYAALGIGPGASDVEINLAYKFVKDSYHQGRKKLDIGKVREAYEILSDPASRKSYDQGGLPRKRAAARKPQVSLFQIQLGLLAIALIVLAIMVGPELKAHLTNFQPGDELVWSQTGQLAGTVMSYEAAHSFREGVVAPAYRLRPAGDDPPQWYPASDIKRHCSKR